MARLDGKIALVSGAAQGIGRAVAELFAAEGATVYAGDVKPVAAAKGIEPMSLDVTSAADWQKAVDAIVAKHGRLDVLINNAGIVLAYGQVLDTEIDDFHKVVGVNLTGTFLGMKTAIPAMRKAGKGSIVNFSSIWGNVGVGGAAAYSAGKGGVRNLTKNAAVSYAAENIRVNSVHPGLIRTPLVTAQSDEMNAGIIGQTPMGRMGTPQEVANCCLFLASDDSSFVTGSELVVDGGYLAQ
ncbi:MAG: SDR family oxidoreductase [Rhizobiaceae bacterium]|nr:SDR family oxidoreductase [Rhizobiaceae bacterium]